MGACDAVRKYLAAESESLVAFNAIESLVVPYPPKHEQLALYVRDSESSILAWEGCIKLIERYTIDSAPLPQPLAEFMFEVLHGTRSKPTKRGRSRYSKYLGLRNNVLIKAVQCAIAAESNLCATRNAASNQDSACDVVSECLADFNIHLSYDAIERIWKDRSRSSDKKLSDTQL